MPALSGFKIPTIPNIPSIQNYRPRRKQPKAQKVTPFGHKRVISPGSPHPYASDEVFNITDTKSSTQSFDIDEVNTDHDPSEPPYSPFQPLRSPNMKLELDVSPDQLTDWIPAHLLSSDSEAYSSVGAQTPEASASTSNSRLQAERPTLDSKDDDGDEYDEDTSVSDDIADLEALTAADFVNGAEPYEEESSVLTVSKPKKAAPAPIKIPNLNTVRPKVQLVRSTSANGGPSYTPKSRPASVISLDEPSASAVSGRTLARALIGNSFVLSNDKRTSRYRSGASTLTRSDSATLPSGEHPFYNAPWMRERTLSATSDTFTPGSKRGSIVPPVPPLPNPELYSPPTKSASPQPGDSKGSKGINGRRSTPVVDLGEEDLADPEPISINFKRSRVSKISEANSSELSTSKSGTESNHSLVPAPLNLEPPESAGSRPTSQSITPDSLNAPSTTRSSGSLELLDYYQLEPSPGFIPPPPPPPPPLLLPPGVPDGIFRPVFTPITEESASQLSPPAPYNSSQDSPRMILGTTPSPVSAGGRIDFTVLRRQSRADGTLLPIGGRPMSSQFNSLPTINPSKPGSIITSLAALDVLGPLDPPPISTIFHRQRVGSAPSPIQVVRDEHDHNTYNLTIAAGPEESSDSPPTTEGSQYARQTFPETPSVFSPGFSPASAGSPAPGAPADSQMPLVPRSAGLPGSKGTVMPSLAQQVLLTRAATSVRHSRQNSFGRKIPFAQHVYGPIAEDDDEVHDNGIPDAQPIEDSREVHITNSPNAAAQLFPDQPPPTPPTQAPPSDPPSSPSMYSGTGENVQGPSVIAPQTQVPSHSHSHSQTFRSKSASSSQRSLPLKDKDLPQLPPPTPTPPRTPTHMIPVPPQPTTTPPLPPQQPKTPPTRPWTPPQRARTPPQLTTRTPPQRARTPPQAIRPPVVPHLPIAPPVQTPTPAITPIEADTPTPSTADTVVLVSPPVVHPPSPSSQHHQPPVERDMGSPFLATFPGSPPPYDAVFNTDQYATTSATTATPTSGAHSSVESHFHLSPGFSPPGPVSPGRDVSRTSSARRGRMRPPLPIGPRRPSNQSESGRTRNGSITSLASAIPSGSIRRTMAPVPPPSPRFQAPSIKFRGYTMDAAKWTFSSTQLQNIVSRAIKQSAEATSIRLLRLETLDNEIPEEVRRLETQRADTKAKFKVLTRRRNELLNQIAAHMEGSRPEEPATAMRLADDLRECSMALDKATEDLYSTGEQLAQLATLCQVHSASALAMALRKLNTSFLKQLAETQTLREQVGTLEAERDEAWQHAESIANDYDHLHEKTQMERLDNSSKRSSRVVASRKSSIRVSKAGLRSARSSISSARMSMSIPSGAKSAFSIDDIPPVPPIPRRRRPMDIVTDIPMRSSAGMSTDGLTPNSETRAMIRAHEELCEMLGIGLRETRARRPRSFVISRDDAESSALAVPSSGTRPISSNATSSGRPTSLPGSARLSDVYDNVMDSDRQAMLATLEMLSD